MSSNALSESLIIPKKKPKIKSIADSPSITIDESIEKTLSETSKAV